MKRLKYTTALLFVLTASFVYSQNSADDIFHLSGNLYVNGNSKAAKTEVNRGLNLFPNDPKLNALALKIKEEEERQQQQQNQQQKQDEKDKQQEQQEQKDESQSQQNEEEERQQEQQQPQNTEGEITKEDAERILNAIEQQEKELLEEMEKRKANARKEPVDKEW